MGEVRIISARACVADTAAVIRLLEDVPDAEEIRAELNQTYFTRRWQSSTQRSFWIASDGTTAICLVLVGLDLDEVIAVWLSFDERRRQPGFTLSVQALGDIVRGELGLSVECDA